MPMLDAAPFILGPSLRVLLLVATAGLIAALALGALLARGDDRRKLLVAGGAIAALYVALVLAVSLASPARHVPIGQRLTFSGLYLDPHLHVAVRDVRWEPAIGSERAAGRFAVVTLEFSSDARRAPQRPYGLEIRGKDEHGRSIARSDAGERALAASAGDLGALERDIAPGASYTRQIVLDVPNDARRPALRVAQHFWVDEFLELWLIGDDESLGHRPAALELVAG